MRGNKNRGYNKSEIIIKRQSPFLVPTFSYINETLLLCDIICNVSLFSLFSIKEEEI